MRRKLAYPGRKFEEAKTGLQAHLDQAVEACEQAGLDAEALVSMGPPVEAILDVLKREKPDLVVMASHGRSGWHRLMMGSVTEGVLRRTQTTVLVVRVFRLHVDTQFDFMSARARCLAGQARPPSLVPPCPCRPTSLRGVLRPVPS